MALITKLEVQIAGGVRADGALRYLSVDFNVNEDDGIWMNCDVIEWAACEHPTGYTETQIAAAQCHRVDSIVRTFRNDMNWSGEEAQKIECDLKAIYTAWLLTQR